MEKQVNIPAPPHFLLITDISMRLKRGMAIYVYFNSNVEIRKQSFGRANFSWLGI